MVLKIILAVISTQGTLGWAPPCSPVGSLIHRGGLRSSLRALGSKDDNGRLQDVIDTGFRPGFAGRDNDASDGIGSTSSSMSSTERAAARRRKQKASLNDRLLAEISEVESDLYRAGKVRAADIPVQEVAPLMGYTEDLQGLNPLLVLGGAGFVLGSSAGMWALTNWLASQFSLHPLAEDTFYVIVRVTTVIRTMVVGGAALGSGIFFMTGLGLLLLSCRVAFGVASGELDMQATQTIARKGLTVDEQFEKMKRLIDNKKE